MKTTPLGHVCICVEDMAKSIEFYKAAFGLEPIAEIETPGFFLTWMGKGRVEGEIPNFVELRVDKGHEGAYDKGYHNNHFALIVDDVNETVKLHEQMGIIDFIVPDGPYFVKDIDGYSIEVMDERVVNSFLLS